MKTSLLRFALLLAFISPLAAFGQCCPYIDGIEVHPSSPNSNDPITIVYTVTTPNMGAYLGATHTIDGDTEIVNACYYMGMLTALQTFVDSITIAPLPEGLHFVRLHASISSDMVECIPTQSQSSVISFSVAQGGPMPICDSVFASPDTFFVQQGTDTSVNLSVSYTGGSDISYSIVRFAFNDSTFIDINDMNVTNGVAGPFTYASD